MVETIFMCSSGQRLMCKQLLSGAGMIYEEYKNKLQGGKAKRFLLFISFCFI